MKRYGREKWITERENVHGYEKKELILIFKQESNNSSSVETQKLFDQSKDFKIIVRELSTVVDSDVTFEVPAEPSRLISINSTTDSNQHREQSTSLSWGVECSHTIDANEEDSLVFGETYSISSAHRDGSPVHVTSGITLQIPTEPTVNGASFSFPSLLHKSCILFNAENEIVSKTLLIGYPSTLQFDIHSNLKSITNVEPERDMVLLNGTFWFKMGVKPINLTFHIDENTGNDGQSREEISSPCTTVELTWKITVDLLM